MIWSRCKSPT